MIVNKLGANEYSMANDGGNGKEWNQPFHVSSPLILTVHSSHPNANPNC
jgi:hypothetical protein